MRGWGEGGRREEERNSVSEATTVVKIAACGAVFRVA